MQMWCFENKLGGNLNIIYKYFQITRELGDNILNYFVTPQPHCAVTVRAYFYIFGCFLPHAILNPYIVLSSIQDFLLKDVVG